MILTVKCEGYHQCPTETSVDTDDVNIDGYLSELEFQGWTFPHGTDAAYSISDDTLYGHCPVFP